MLVAINVSKDNAYKLHYTEAMTTELHPDIAKALSNDYLSQLFAA